MARWDIENTNLFMSFGIFTLMFIFLGIMHTLYYVIHLVATKCRSMRYVENYISKKLFYSGIIRYLVQANLKIVHNSAFFLLLNYGLESSARSLN